MLASEHSNLQSTAETIYRMNADDYVREECRAREDNLRLQRSIQHKHERELKERDEKLSEQSKQLSEQKKQLSEQNKQLSEQKKQLSEQKKQLSEQKKQLAETEAENAKLRAELAALKHSQHSPDRFLATSNLT